MHRRGRLARLGVVAALAAGAALSGAPATAAGDDDSPQQKRPKKWDERVLPLVDAVESLRGLHFEHPVPVEFLTDRTFEKELESDPGQLTKQERQDLEDSTAALRALGLFEGDADALFESATEVDAEGTLAFYDIEEERVAIRGQDLDVETEVTVVHELVHALQDQHFNLDKLTDDTETSAEELALDALIEGDAVRIEEDYVAGLSPEAQDEYYAASANTAAGIDEGLSDAVPEIIPVTFALPYDLGRFFVLDLVTAGENERVDDAFADPPVTDEHVLDAATFLSGDEPDDIARVPLADDEKRVGERDAFGAITWYLTLAARIDRGVALEAAEGWGGDEFVQFKRNGDSCVRIGVAGETPADTDQMAAALDQWVATLPAGAARTDRTDVITLTSCDSDEGLPPAPNSIDDAETLLFNRADLAYFLSQPPDPIEPALARCAATRLVLDPANTQLIEATEFTEEQAVAFFDRVDAAVAECG